MLTRSPKDPETYKSLQNFFVGRFPHFGQILGKHHELFGHLIDTYQKYIDAYHYFCPNLKLSKIFKKYKSSIV